MCVSIFMFILFCFKTHLLMLFSSLMFLNWLFIQSLLRMIIGVVAGLLFGRPAYYLCLLWCCTAIFVFMVSNSCCLSFNYLFFFPLQMEKCRNDIFLKKCSWSYNTSVHLMASFSTNILSLANISFCTTSLIVPFSVSHSAQWLNVNFIQRFALYVWSCYLKQWQRANWWEEPGTSWGCISPCL